MASEFVRRVRHVEDINTFSKWGLEEGDLVLTNDNKMYALIGQEFKQLDNMEKVWATSEAGKYLMVGNDGIVKPMVIDDIRKGDNTWVGKNIFTQPINGNTMTNEAQFNDFAVVAKNMNTYNGTWFVRGGGVKNGYASNVIVYSTIMIISGNSTGTGFISYSEFGTNRVYVSAVDGGNIRGFYLLSNDNNVLHKFGNETSTGDKTFNGQTTLLNGNFGLRVTNTGIVKTTDGGKNWTSL